MNCKSMLMMGSLVAALAVGTSATAATGYCTIPLLYPTNIRTACEQLGAKGMSGLYSSSRMFNQMLRHPHLADVAPAKTAPRS